MIGDERTAVITQVISTIQGEGKFLGVPSCLVRFGMCNLNCPFCDTKWSLHPNVEETTNEKLYYIIKPTKITVEILYNILKEQFNINHIRNIMVTGGEPLLNKEFLIELFRKMLESTYFKNKCIDIETNGILIPKFFKYINDLCMGFSYDNFNKNIKLNFNISPKLDLSCYNAGMTQQKLINIFQNVVKIIDELEDAKETTYNFKFIYNEKFEYELIKFINNVEIPRELIYIMALTPDKSTYPNGYTDPTFISDFQKSCLKTVEFCMKNGYTYSPREHIYLFGEKKNEYCG